MPTAWAGRRRQVGVDVEKARAGDVTLEVELPSASRLTQLPPTIDELVARLYQLPSGDGGSGTSSGWIT